MKNNTNEVSEMSHNVWYVNTAREVVSLQVAIRRSSLNFNRLNPRLSTLLDNISSRGSYFFDISGCFVILSPMGRVLVRARPCVRNGVDSVDLYFK